MGYTIIRPQSHEEWLRERNLGIGSSDVGTLAGVSHYDTPISLYMKRKGLAERQPETNAMRAGHVMEPAIAYMYHRATGDIMDPTSEGDWIAADNQRPYLRVSVDRIFYDKNLPESERRYENGYIVECKNYDRPLTEDSYPEAWYFQVQYQMGVLGVKKAVIAWFGDRSTPFGYTTVPFNKTVYNAIVDLVDDFWLNHIVPGVVPDTVMNLDDVKLRYTNIVDEQVVASEQILDTVKRYNALYPEYKRIEKELDEYKFKIGEFMADKNLLVDENGEKLCSYNKTKLADGFDTKRFAEEHADLYEQYRKTGRYTRTMSFRKPSKKASATANNG